MTQTTKEIFEKYEIRKTKKQKTDFIEFVKQKCNEWGYEAKVEKGSFGVRNVVIGNPENAKVIYTAHYDTCPVLPFPNLITPKSFGLYLLYQLVIVLSFFVIAFILGLGIGLIGALIGLPSEVISPIAVLIYWLLLALMLFGPANKHTANDNTSGITVLFDTMEELAPEKREDVAFVFFDLEEAGLIGSNAFASKHKNIKKNTLVVNFDCVSDGQNILIILKKYARKYKEAFETAFASNENIQSEIITKFIFYPSDQSQFKHGVGVAAFKNTKGGLLYLDHIHTKKDTVYEEANIEYLKNSAVKLIELL